MRGLALLLLLTNLSFYTWAHYVDNPTPQYTLTPPLTDTIPRLVLTHERTTEKDSPTPPHTQTDTTSASIDSDQNSQNLAPTIHDSTAINPACVSIGPFQDLASAARAAATLQSTGFTTKQRLAQGEVWVGYWVNLPNLATHAEAESTLRHLQDAGINDIYLLPATNQTSTLSLGVFMEYTRAQRRVDEIRALGFTPQLSDRTRSGTLYWLDVETHSADTQPDLANLQPTVGTISRLVKQSCPENETTHAANVSATSNH